MNKHKKNSPFLCLQDIAGELDKCARCGECRSVCPIFDALQWEKFSARGKVALTRAILNGQMEWTPGYEKVIQNCLLCLACVQHCSSGVRMDRIVLAARNQLAHTKGLPLFKRLVHGLLLTGHELMDLFARGGSLAQYLLFQRIPRESGLKRRFPLPVVEKERYIPSLVHHPFRTQMPEENKVPQARKTVLFFTGCLVNYIYPHIGLSLVRVLNVLKTNVIIPRKQHCCGAPLEVGGDPDTTRSLAQKNLDVLFAGSLDIVTACASGGFMLKKVYPDLFTPSDPYYPKALSVAGRTFDISEYLVKKIGIPELKKHLPPPSPRRTTYHDPCHLARGQGVTQEPRELLRLLFGENYCEMTAANQCCGSGGTYGLTHRQTSLQILNKKTENIVATHADIVATGCPGCMIQLQEGLNRHQKDSYVFHIIELISQQLSHGHSKPEQRNFSGGKQKYFSRMLKGTTDVFDI